MSAGRILVVDDDPQIRRAMKATLTARHYQVSDSRTGEEALDKLRSETYDLVLLDMNMPGTGGIETCRLMRSSSDIAIIMLTSKKTEKGKGGAPAPRRDCLFYKAFRPPKPACADPRALAPPPAAPG